MQGLSLFDIETQSHLYISTTYFINKQGLFNIYDIETHSQLGGWGVSAEMTRWGYHSSQNVKTNFQREKSKNFEKKFKSYYIIIWIKSQN